MKNQKGFSLIELLIAMVIMGFLIAGVALLASNVQRNSRDTRRKELAQSVKLGVEDFKGNYNSNPSSITWMASLPGTGKPGFCITTTGGTCTAGSGAEYVVVAAEPIAEGTNPTGSTAIADCKKQELVREAVVVCYDSASGDVWTALESSGAGWQLRGE